MKAGTSSLGLKALVIFCVFAVCALTPAIAGARIIVPPGSTEGDQYFEEVPNGGGSGSVNHGGGGGGAGGSAAGPAVAATQALNSLGQDGQAAANLANTNRPPQQTKSNQKQNPNSQQASSTEGEGGMGFLFPLLLVVTALAAVGYGLRRRLNPA